jgi:hypothetical protein
MIYIHDGDEVVMDGTTYEVIEGELVEKDDRTPLERRLDKIEERLDDLEHNNTYQIKFPPSDPCPDPWTPTNPWTNPYVPGTTWVSSAQGGTK